MVTATARRVVPDLLIVVGVLLSIAGVYLLGGLAVALIVAGIVVAVYGALADLRWS